MSGTWNAPVPVGPALMRRPEKAPYFLGSSQRAALDQVTAAIRRRDACVALTGVDGIGKSVVLDATVAALAGQPVRFVWVRNRVNVPLTIERLLFQIGRDRGVDLERAEVEQVAEALASADRAEQTVLVIEQAETLARQTLAFLTMVLKACADRGGRLQLLLVGTPALSDLVADEVFAAVARQMTRPVVIAPLSDEEAGRYIAVQLRLAGKSLADIPSNPALMDVIRSGEGVPSRINTALARVLQPTESQAGPTDWPAIADLLGFARPAAKGAASRTQHPRTAPLALTGPKEAPQGTPEPMAATQREPARRIAPGGSSLSVTPNIPRHWRLGVRLLGVAAAGLAILAVTGVFYRRLPHPFAGARGPEIAVTRPPTPSPAEPSAPPQAGAIPAAHADRPPGGNQATATAAAVPALPSAPNPPAEDASSVQLRRDFNAFLDTQGGPAAHLTAAQREVLFQQYKERKARDPSAVPMPPAMANAAFGPALADHRVVVHYLGRSSTGAARAEALVAALQGSVASAESRAVPSAPRRGSVRYFFNADKPAAVAMAAALQGQGSEWRVRHFVDYWPRPSRGTIEVWLPDR